jgi:hypothetical protein
MKRLIFLFVLLGLFWGCSQKSNVLEVAFTVDETLLAPVVEDSLFHFSFQPPREWAEADSSIMNAIFSKLQSDTREQIGSVHVYVSPDKFGFLASSVLFEEAADVSKRFNLDLKASIPGINISEFTSSGTYFYQYIFVNNGLVNIKLLIPCAEMQTVMIDFMMSDELYKEQVHTVESVIGSFKRKM